MTFPTFMLPPFADPTALSKRDTDWFQAAKYGVFMHFLPGNDGQLGLVKAFGVDGIARDLEAMGAKYFVVSLGQNSGYFNSPNGAYERITGYAPGEHCSLRDLPLDLYRALHPKGIELMLYLPCQAPNGDARAQRAFGLAEGNKDQMLTPDFAAKWSEVIQEWSDRYGDKVTGWWFDGGYGHVHFDEEIAARYAAAVKHGNPKSMVTFNPGAGGEVTHYMPSEDYTAGEINDPLGQVPKSRWVQGSQWHVLTYLGTSWEKRDVRYVNEEWTDWLRKVTEKGGVVTLELGPNWDPKAGPIGSFSEVQIEQMKAIKAAIYDGA